MKEGETKLPPIPFHSAAARGRVGARVPSRARARGRPFISRKPLTSSHQRLRKGEEEGEEGNVDYDDSAPRRFIYSRDSTDGWVGDLQGEF